MAKNCVIGELIIGTIMGAKKYLVGTTINIGGKEKIR